MEKKKNCKVFHSAERPQMFRENPKRQGSNKFRRKKKFISKVM